MPALVYFSKDLNRASCLFDSAGFSGLISPQDSVALKIHFGEPGNTAFLKPEEVKPICEKVKTCGGKPFYTDCNTLYDSPRKTTTEHLKVAKNHGYVLTNAGAEAIIPEETDWESVKVNQKHFKAVQISGEIRRADVIIALTHFKGHEVSGFGGALKNLGMGCGTRLGKLKMHQECRGCAQAPTCKKNINLEACWVGSPTLVQEKIVEYAYGAVKDKKCAFFNFIVRVSPNCDCYPHNDPPIVPDIGVLASLDPVAIDQASADLVNKNGDLFKKLYPEVDWSVQLKHAEAVGLGSRKYQLVIK